MRSRASCSGFATCAVDLASACTARKGEVSTDARASFAHSPLRFEERRMEAGGIESEETCEKIRVFRGAMLHRVAPCGADWTPGSNRNCTSHVARIYGRAPARKGRAAQV
jgi:hypothetical protein